MKTFEEAFNIAAQWEVDNHCGPAALVARALYRHLRDAALLPQPKEAVPADCDVRKIMLRVDPGPDGEGVEVYARNVGEVEALLSELGDKEEEAYASQLALPAGPLDRIRKALRGRNFNDFPGDDAELLESAANVIAEDGIVLRALPAGPSPFPERDMSKPAEQQGIFRKFEVRRVDGSDAPGGKHHGCRYFVIDLEHDKHAPAAMAAYGMACASTHPQLSADILAEFPAAELPAGPVPEGDALDAQRYRKAVSHGIIVLHNGAKACVGKDEADVALDAIATSPAVAQPVEDERAVEDAGSWLNVLVRYADDVYPLLDIIDKRAGGSSGATEKLHELADAIKFVVNKLRPLYTANQAAVAHPVADAAMLAAQMAENELLVIKDEDGTFFAYQPNHAGMDGNGRGSTAIQAVQNAIAALCQPAEETQRVEFFQHDVELGKKYAFPGVVKPQSLVDRITSLDWDTIARNYQCDGNRPPAIRDEARMPVGMALVFRKIFKEQQHMAEWLIHHWSNGHNGGVLMGIYEVLRLADAALAAKGDAS